MKRPLNCRLAPWGRLPTFATLALIAALAAAAGASRDVGTAASPAKAAESADAGPLWLTDFDEALKVAAERERPVFLRFTADWCPPCQVMERNVFTDGTVRGALAERVVPMVVDIDDDAGAELAWRYKVRGVPTLLLVDSRGEVLARGGFMSAEGLVEFLQGP